MDTRAFIRRNQNASIFSQFFFNSSREEVTSRVVTPCGGLKPAKPVQFVPSKTALIPRYSSRNSRVIDRSQLITQPNCKYLADYSCVEYYYKIQRIKFIKSIKKKYIYAFFITRIQEKYCSKFDSRNDMKIGYLENTNFASNCYMDFLYQL